MRGIETQRLLVRPLTPDDAAFVLELVNDPDWLRFIGDKHVQTLDDARDYIQKEGTDKYPLPGLGLHVVALKDTGAPIGICGLKKRASPGHHLRRQCAINSVTRKTRHAFRFVYHTAGCKPSGAFV